MSQVVRWHSIYIPSKEFADKLNEFLRRNSLTQLSVDGILEPVLFKFEGMIQADPDTEELYLILKPVAQEEV